MTAVHSFPGRDEEARIEVAEILRINPKSSLDKLAKSFTYKEKGNCERFLGALRKTGLR